MRSHPGIIPGVQCVHPDGSGDLGNIHTVIILSMIHTDKVRSVLTSQSSLVPIRNNIWNKCTVQFFSHGIYARQTTIVNAFKTWHLWCHLPPGWQREGARSSDCSRLSRVILPISSQTTLCQYLKGISEYSSFSSTTALQQTRIGWLTTEGQSCMTLKWQMGRYSSRIVSI